MLVAFKAWVEGGDMTGRSDDPWTTRAKNLLKGELKRRGMSYSTLATELGEMGITETERNIANKLSRGTFTAAFLLQCLAAIGARRIDLDE
jgi:hypothetical protein